MNSSLVFYYSFGVLAVCVFAGGVFLLSVRFKKSIPQWALYVFLVFPVYMLIAQYLKLRSLNMYADVSHWGQIVYNIATRWVPESLNVGFVIPGAQNYFSIHFTPFIYIFGLLHRVVPLLETILFANGVFMLSSGIPLYLLVKRMLSSKQLALLFVALLFWYPTFQYITLYEFEMLRFSIPTILWMLYFWEKKHLPLYFLFAVIATLVREEVGLTIFMFGVYLFFFQKERVRGAVTSVIGIVSFFSIVLFVIPSFNNAVGATYLPSSLFGAFGTTPLEIAGGILANPLLLIKTIFDPVKLANIGMLFVPLAFFPFLSPTVLLSIVGNIGVTMMSEAITNSSYMLYYIAPSVPFIFYALIKAWPKMISVIANPEGVWRSLGRRLTRFARNDNQEHALMNALLAAVIVSNVFFGPSPLSLQFWFKDIRPAPFRTQDFHWSTYRISDHHKKVDNFIDMIPDNAIVSAPQFLHPRLYKKRGAMIFPRIASKDGFYKAEYILFDRTNNGLKPESPAFIDEQEFSTVDTNMWELIESEDGYELYRRAL